MSETNEYDRESIERLLFQMDNMLHTRVNALLLAESIFFVAGATVWNNLLPFSVIAFLGVVTTLVFGVTNLRIYFRVYWLIKVLDESDKFYHDYLTMKDTDTSGWGRLSVFLFNVMRTSKQPRQLETGWLFSFGLVGIFTTGWILFYLAVLVVHDCGSVPAAPPI